MVRFLVPLIFILSTVTSQLQRQKSGRVSYPAIASESQIKFAIENKYDDTGPGAKQREYAYNTYNNIEDALIAYLDDPDTKLPDHEKAKAINKLLKSPYYVTAEKEAARFFHKHGDFKLFKPIKVQTEAYNVPDIKVKPLKLEPEIYNIPDTKIFYPDDGKIGIVGVKSLADVEDGLTIYHDKKAEQPYKFQKIHSVKGSPLSLAHYTRDPDLKPQHEHGDSRPKYTFSYGVHDKTTGDSKTVKESRDGGTVHGFYSLIDADGKTRTVQYVADDRQGFRATVKTH